MLQFYVEKWADITLPPVFSYRNSTAIKTGSDNGRGLPAPPAPQRGSGVPQTALGHLRIGHRTCPVLRALPGTPDCEEALAGRVSQSEELSRASFNQVSRQGGLVGAGFGFLPPRWGH